MLTANIPLLEASDIECRVQSVKKNKNGKVGAVLLVYKDARVDMKILDQVFGIGNWQRTHEVINGNLFCNIDIWDEDKKTWVRKQDVGTESNTEKEKGQASDSFKRAGFNVGIGRELYTAPFIYVALNEGEYYENNNTIKCSPSTKFSVSHIAYNDRREITELKVVDSKGKVRFDMAKKQTPSQQPPFTPADAPDGFDKAGKVTIEQAKTLQQAAIDKYGDNHAQLFEELTGYKKFMQVPAKEYSKILAMIKSDGNADPS